MRESLIDRLCCPVDLSPLRLDISKQDVDGHIIAGQLQCMACQQAYPIKEGVPDLLPAESAQINGKDLERLQVATVDRFGFEWLYFHDWGWLTEYPNIPNAEEKFRSALVEHTRRDFWGKSLFREDDLHPRLLILDAGCGNGRFTDQAARTGAEVIGIDLGWGVYSAFEHTRSLPHVHIVRGDLFRLPFADDTFDRIFAIGVLQHTGNAEAAFDAIVRTLCPDGLIAVRVYGQGRRTYEVFDALIRAVTTCLPINMQIGFARITAATARWLCGSEKRRWRFYRRLISHVNLLPTEHEMYDWWSAPIATHHTLDEVQGWFVKNQLKIVRTKPPLNDVAAERIRRYTHGPISVLGQRSLFIDLE